MSSVYTDIVPKEMMQSEVDEEGWYEWKLMTGTLSVENYNEVEKRFKAKLPDNFINWHKRYFFDDGDCSLLRLPNSFPTKPLESIVTLLDNSVYLVSQGLIPFGDEGNDTGPLVFDTRNQTDSQDFPIRVHDHEYYNDLNGLSEIIFSSFNKMLECITHFLTEMENETKQSFEIIPDFFKIDPDGAGNTGEGYWESWIEMEKEIFEEFGD